MDNLWIQESMTNEDEGYRIHDTDVYETHHNNIKDLFKSLQKEYGRCMGKIFVDRYDGLLGDTAVQVGWIFEKKVKYDDTDAYFTQATWVAVHTKEPEHITKNHYYKFGGK
jgi:hypothetical protein